MRHLNRKEGKERKERASNSLPKGGLNGFSSFLLRLPAENFTAVALANALPSGPGVEPGRLAHEAVEFCLGEKLPPRPVPKVNQRDRKSVV